MLTRATFLTRSGGAVATRALGKTASFSKAKKSFPSFTKYGLHAAFQVQPIAPVFSPVPGRDYLKTKRLGCMMLSWAPAAEQGKNYAYNDKVFFSLSPNEVGLVLEVLDGNMSEATLSHSPNVNAKVPDETSRRSLLIVTRGAGSDGLPITEFNLNASTENRGEVKERVSLNAGEARVLKELLTYSLPRLYAFQNVFDGPPVIEGDSNDNDWGTSSGSGRKQSYSNNRGAAPEWPF